MKITRGEVSEFRGEKEIRALLASMITTKRNKVGFFTTTLIIPMSKRKEENLTKRTIKIN